MKIKKFLVLALSDEIAATLIRELLIETLNLDPWVEVQVGEVFAILQMILWRYYNDEK